MSEVKRYSLTLHKVKGKFESPEFERDNGEWVKWDDYANLKAENERLHTLLSISERSVQNLLKTPEWEQIAKLTADYRDLEAENERLRKAGDGLGWAVHRLKERFWDADEEANKAIHDWNAAKDGKPTE